MARKRTFSPRRSRIATQMKPLQPHTRNHFRNMLVISSCSDFWPAKQTKKKKEEEESEENLAPSYQRSVISNAEFTCTENLTYYYAISLAFRRLLVSKSWDDFYRCAGDV